LFEAYALASQMPLRLASFFAATWDYTLYSEGFLAPFPAKGQADTASSFISIDDLINHPTLDTSYIPIQEFVQSLAQQKNLPAGKVSPLQLADMSEADSRRTLALIKPLRAGASGAFACELDDLETWAYLGLYLADKLRAGVALQTYRVSGVPAEQQKAITYLQQCQAHWEKVSAITSGHYREVPYIDGQTWNGPQHYRDAWRFSWQKYLPQVARDLRIAREAQPVTGQGN
jgi:hypothetical protein